MRRALLLTMLSLTACGSDDGVASAPSGDLALPVAAPMAVRERLLEDLGAQKEAARQRRSDLDAIIRPDR